MTTKVNVHPSHHESLKKGIPHGLALTGRIRSWLENPVSRCPASCTTFNIKDSMEGRDGIEDSWIFTSKGLRYAAGVALNYSELRAKGTKNGKGLTASGLCSFIKIASVQNEILRRGGVFKNGAITVYCDYDHPDCMEFLNLDVSEYAWVKRAVYVDEGLRKHPIKKALAEAVDKGYVWLAKKQWDSEGNRLYSNVCLEILLKSRGTCLLSHINAGLLEPKEIPQAFEQGMEYLCNLHKHTNVDGEGFYYLSKEEDRQVGLGVIGLGSHLAIQGVSYADFVYELEQLEAATNGFQEDLIYQFCPCAIDEGDKAKEIAYYFALGFKVAGQVADKNNMDRAFTVAPTATCFQKHDDLEGYCVTPEISAPIDLEIERASETFGIVEYEFNPNCETAFQVGWGVQWRLLNVWQRLMDSTGKGHSISANIWSTQPVDKHWIDTFLDSDLKTTYYRLSVSQFSNDKSQVLTDETLEKMASVYAIEDVVDDGLGNNSVGSIKAKNEANLKEAGGVKQFTSFNDIMEGECSACGGS